MYAPAQELTACPRRAATNPLTNPVLLVDLGQHTVEVKALDQQTWMQERCQLQERIYELESAVRSRDETISLYRTKVGGFTAQLRQSQSIEAELCEAQGALRERDEAYRLLERRTRAAEQANLAQEQERQEQLLQYEGVHAELGEQIHSLQDHYVQVVDNLEAQLAAMAHERDRLSDLLFEAKERQKITAAELAFVQRLQSGCEQPQNFLSTATSAHTVSRQASAPATRATGLTSAPRSSQQLASAWEMPANRSSFNGPSRQESAATHRELHPYTQCI